MAEAPVQEDSKNISSVAGCSNAETKSLSDVTDSFANIKIKDESKPICLIVLGEAGSGKTTFVRQLTSYLHANNSAPPYVINIDPGSTTVDQVLQSVDKNSTQCNYVILDTPGDIEVFTFSASGMIITANLSTTYPTVFVYVMDTVKCESPAFFMAGMVPAFTISRKTRLPLIAVLNKTDVLDCQFVLEWMRDFEVYQEALARKADPSFTDDVTRSMGSVLHQFYSGIEAVGVSSTVGTGLEEFFQSVEKTTNEYETVFKPWYEKIKKMRENMEENEKANQEKAMKN